MLDAVPNKEITSEIAADIERRYGEGQALNHIRVATEISIERIKETLLARGVQLRAPGALRRRWQRPYSR